MAIKWRYPFWIRTDGLKGSLVYTSKIHWRVYTNVSLSHLMTDHPWPFQRHSKFVGSAQSDKK